MGPEVSNRTVVVLAVLAIVLSVAGTLSVLVLTQDSAAVPQEQQNVGHVFVNVVNNQPSTSSGLISLEVQRPEGVAQP